MKTEELEQRMRPGAMSEDGFLGPDESLQSVLDHDAKVLAQLGVSATDIADRLEHLLTWAVTESRLRTSMSLLEMATSAHELERKELLRYVYAGLGDDAPPPEALLDRLRALDLPEGRGSSDAVHRLGDYELRYVQWRGLQDCPWGCRIYGQTPDPTLMELIETLDACRAEPFTGLPHPIPMKWFGSIDFELWRVGGPHDIVGPGLIVHLIREHAFFEGLESPHRCDPRILCSILKLGSA